jgi:hypothetical protein
LNGCAKDTNVMMVSNVRHGLCLLLLQLMNQDPDRFEDDDDEEEEEGEDGGGAAAGQEAAGQGAGAGVATLQGNGVA